MDPKDRIIAIGDIHGEISKLEKLLTELKPTGDDRLIFLGDYVDRGENSRLVLERLRELDKEFDCIFLKGNHEDMFLKSVSGHPEILQVWLANGGHKTLQDFAGGIPDSETLLWLSSLRTLYWTEDYYFVHAGLTPGRPATESTDEDRLWSRGSFLDSTWNWGKKVICGHNIQHQGPLIKKNLICIDTGSFIPGHALTAITLPDETFTSVLIDPVPIPAAGGR